MASTDAMLENHDRRSLFAKEVLTAAEARPWTTTRCQRLLRPLQSRIASIRRDLATPGDASTATIRAPPTPIRGDKTSQYEWLVARRRRCRTYSQRRLREEAQHCAELPTQDITTLRTFRDGRADTQHDQIYPSTPLLKRARGHLMSSPLMNRNASSDAPCELSSTGTEQGPGGGKRRQSEKNKHLDTLRAICTSSRYTDFEAIYRSFEALLIATKDTQPTRTGSRSLLGICLQRVPEYISGVEAWEQHEAEVEGSALENNGIDTPTRVYNDLEQLGAGVGWKHLRVIARADGIRALTTAIEDGLWTDEFTQILVDLSIRCAAFPEAEKLMSAQSNRILIEASAADCLQQDWFDTLPHKSLINYAKLTAKETFVFKQYRQLVSHSLFPATWLASEHFDEVWNMAVNKLARSRAANEALELVTTLLVSTVMQLPNSSTFQHKRKPTTAVETSQQHTVIGGLATISSMSFLGDYELTQLAFNRERLVKIGDRLRYILHSCVTSSRQRRKYLSNSGYSLACIALICSTTDFANDNIASGLRQSMEGLWKEKALDQPGRTPKWREHFDILTSFISSMSITCSRGTGESPQHFLDVFIGRLQSLDLDAQIRGDLKMAAAFHLAQKTNNVKDLIYAENLHRESTISDDKNALKTPFKACSKKMLFTGYSWDETIGEWVTASPLSKDSSRLIRNANIRSRQVEVDNDDDLLLGRVHVGILTPPLSVTSKRKHQTGSGRSRASLPATTTYKAFSLEDHDDEGNSSSDTELQVTRQLPERPKFKVERPQTKDIHKDELADDHDDEDKENDHSYIAQKLDSQQRGRLRTQHDTKRRRRTHSGLFTTRESRTRDSSSSTMARVTASRTLRRADVSDSDDELGL